MCKFVVVYLSRNAHWLSNVSFKLTLWVIKKKKSFFSSQNYRLQHERIDTENYDVNSSYNVSEIGHRGCDHQKFVQTNINSARKVKSKGFKITLSEAQIEIRSYCTNFI